MRRILGLFGSSVALLAVLAGCSSLTDVEQVAVEEVVARDGVPFSSPALPLQVLDRLAQHKLVVVGETHHLRDHYELMARLVRDLHARGFRQLLLEWPQMADWLLADLVLDGGLVPDWRPPVSLGGEMIEAVRDFNRTLSAEERVHVRGIDVNLSDYGGLDAFLDLLESLSEQLPDSGPIGSFLLAAHQPPDRHEEALTVLRSELQARRSELVDLWGSAWYETVAEMIDVELVSVTVRGMREDDYDGSVRIRENELKRLADLRLSGYAHRTLLNVGGNHAQKSYLKGTDQEWLGDYLVHRSTAVGGSTIVLGVTAARIVSGSTVQYDIMDASPGDELFRLMHETWPAQTVFLPLDDPLFSTGGVRMNFEGRIHRGRPKQVYDAFLQYPLAHRVPLP